MAEDWRKKAVCLTEEPEKFFPDPSDVRGTTDALAICGGCTQRATCLGLAMASEADGLRHGIFGGTTPRQRAQIAKRVAS